MRPRVSYHDLDSSSATTTTTTPPQLVHTGQSSNQIQRPILRLVLSSSTILQPPRVLVLLDHPVVTFGRDRSFEPRVRLPEIEVSKSHATVFWHDEDEDSGYWAVVDNGSMHGTWLNDKRLSESRTASRPYELKHSDQIRIGSTEFLVHHHRSFACETCSIASDSSNLISLLPTSTTAVVLPSENGYIPTKSKAEKEVDRRERMKGLKDRYTLPVPTASTSAATPSPLPPASTISEKVESNYIDRAKIRRSIHPRPAPSSLPSLSAAPPSTSASTTSATFSSPFVASSKGSILLAKLTKAPSTQPTTGLGTLKQAKTFERMGTPNEKPGLGSRPLVVIGAETIVPVAGSTSRGAGKKRDWREAAREASWKRFKEME